MHIKNLQCISCNANDMGITCMLCLSKVETTHMTSFAFIASLGVT